MLRLSIGSTLVVYFAVGALFRRPPDEVYADNKGRLLSGIDYKITARVQVLESSSMDLDVDQTIVEHFSHKERRSRLALHAKTSDNNRYANSNLNLEYYSDSYGQLARVSQSLGSKWKCELADGSDLMGDLFGSSAKVESELTAANWLKPRQEVPKHAIGVSRLLFAIEANRNKMALASDAPKMRNHNTSKYKLSLPLNFDKMNRLTDIVVHYRADEAAESELSVPMRVWLSLPSGCEVVIELMLFEVIASNDPINGLRDNLVSELALPAGFGCSNKSSKLQRTTLFGRHSDGSDDDDDDDDDDDASDSALAEPKVVSFRMLLWDVSLAAETGPLADRFVQYDGYMRAMRKDNLASPGGRRTPRELQMSIIHDINANTKYMIHAPARVADQRPYDSGAPSLLAERDETGECYAVRCVNGDKIGSSIYEPIVPADGLVELGAGSIRGVPVKIFERPLELGESLPALFFEKLDYSDESGRFRTAEADVNSDENSDDDDDSEAAYDAIVYYIANLPSACAADIRAFATETNERRETAPGSGSGGGDGDGGDVHSGRNKDTNLVPTLMQVEVYMAQSVRYRAEIFDFGWRLTESLAGDQAKDLFSLRDKCNPALEFGGGGGGGGGGVAGARATAPVGSFAKLSMRLDHIGSMRAQDAPATGMADWLGPNAAIRDVALVRALGARELIAVSRLSRFRSKVIGPNEGAKMFVQLEVDDRLDSAPMHRLKRIASVAAADEAIVVAEPAAKSRADCLWAAMRRRKALGERRVATSVAFTFCRRACLVVAVGALEQRPRTSGSQSSRDLQGCALMSIELELESEPKPKSPIESSPKVLASNWIYQYLSSGGSAQETLHFPMIDSAQRAAALGSPVSFAIFAIKSLATTTTTTSDDDYRRNTNWAANDGRDDCDALAGLSLTEASGRRESLAPVAAAAAATTTTTEPPETAARAAGADRWLVADAREACRLRCASDARCGSYSICVRPTSAECFVSALSFADADLLATLEAAKSRIRNGERLARARKPLSLPARAGRGPIELRVDRRCRVYNRRALDDFRLRAHNLKTFVDAKGLVSVADVESCASLCAARNAQELPSNTTAAEVAVGQLLADDWCDSFKYADLDAAAVSASTLEAIGAQNFEHSGVCALAGGRGVRASPPSQQQQQTRPRPVPLMMRLYEFNHATLFEAHRRVRLRPPPEDADTGKGQVASAAGDVEKCARLCFSRAVELSPACKSFDVIQSASAAVCVFNSMDLREAGERNLVWRQTEADADADAASAAADWVHYEPRARAWRVVRAEADAAGRPKSEPAGADRRPGELAAAAAIVVAAVAGGLSVGVALARRQLARARPQTSSQWSSASTHLFDAMDMG